MTDGRPGRPGAGDAVPGIDESAEGRPGPVLRVLEVDGERFALRRGPQGDTQYDWTSGPDADYGFACSGPPDRPDGVHVAAIRSFLSMIDPATGHIAED